jgi:hypothetical protein
MIVVVPAVIPVTSPVEASTVAIPNELLDQLPPKTVDEKVVDPPTHIDWFPLSMPALAGDVMVTGLVAVAFEHPPIPFTV